MNDVTMAGLNAFEFMYDVLDATYPELVEIFGEATDSVITDALTTLQKRYEEITHGTIISYRRPQIRFAYIYAYAGTRANVVASILGQYPELDALLARPAVRVTSIGGGPGTELVGLAKWMRRRGASLPVEAATCDSEASWSHTWAHVSRCLSKYHPIYGTYLHHDILDPATWSSGLQHLSADLYTISYCLSEFCFAPSREDAGYYFRELFAHAPSGAYFLCLDVLHTTVFNWFDKMAADWGLQLLADCTGTTRGRYEPYVAELGEAAVAARSYRGGFGRPTPRIDLKVAYRLCVKP